MHDHDPYRQFQPPPPPPPMPPARKASTPTIVVGAILATLVVGAIALGAISERSGSPSGTSGRSSAADGLERWVDDHGDKSAVIMSRVEGYADRVASAASAGDLSGALSACEDGAVYLADVALDPVSLSPDAPEQWTRTITLWSRGFAACADGDIDSAARYISDGTAAVDELTDLLGTLR